MLCLLVTIALFMTFYAYFGYPLALLAINSQRDPEDHENLSHGLSPDKVGIIVTVRNEAAVIKKKIEDTLELKFSDDQSVAQAISQGNCELIIASDCSDDETDSIVESFADRGVRLVRLPERGGKERAQKAAIAECDTDVIIFTDAKITLNEMAVANFKSHFKDSKVGAVSSVDRVVTGEEGGSGEGLYVRYEMWLRAQESEFNSLVGLSGSCFAVRKNIADALQVDIPSDFSLLLETQRQGLKGVNAPDVIGTYRAVRTEQEEFSRTVRTVLRGITACFSRAEVLSPTEFGVFSWQVWSHKICRWLVPWFLLVAFLGSLVLAGSSTFFALTAIALTTLFGLAVLGLAQDTLQEQKAVKIAVFFCVVNAAIAVAWIKYLSGQRSVSWTPSAK